MVMVINLLKLFHEASLRENDLEEDAGKKVKKGKKGKKKMRHFSEVKVSATSDEENPRYDQGNPETSHFLVRK